MHPPLPSMSIWSSRSRSFAHVIAFSLPAPLGAAPHFHRAPHSTPTTRRSAFRQLRAYAGTRKTTLRMVCPLSTVSDVEWLSTPIAVSGPVQRGLGRGSRDLGTSTANLPGTLLADEPEAARDGVYFGYGRVPKFGNVVVNMVASLGHNITFDDVKERVFEAYLMSDIFDCDFYGEEMKLCIVGYMRPEYKFDSLDQLIQHIRNDVAVAKAALDLPNALRHKDHATLTS